MPFAPWCWRDKSEMGSPVWHPPKRIKLDPGKLLTVVSWDAGYREEHWLDLSFKCLQMQTIREKVNFLHIEWSDKPNPILEKYPFISVLCLGFKNDLSVWPSYDVGLQWEIGLYLSRTPYVLYFHNDIIIRDQLEIIENKILKHKNCIMFTGYENNYKGKKSPEHRAEFLSLVEKDPNNFDQLARTYHGRFFKGPHVNANLTTVNKIELIRRYNGFFWNMKSERWDGLAHRAQPSLGGVGLMRRTMLDKNGLHAQKDMAVFSVPHGGQGKHAFVQEKRPIITKYDYHNTLRYYSHFLTDWLPYHKFSYYREVK